MTSVAAQFARSIPMTAGRSAGEGRPVRVRARPETGKLFLDFWHKGVRCREQTGLCDTPDNRAKLQILADLVQRELREGVFDFAAVFPDSPRRLKFVEPPNAGRAAPTPAPATSADPVPSKRRGRRPSPEWTASEDMRLRLDYIQRGARHLARSEAFRGKRTVAQIERRARALGLSVTPKRRDPGQEWDAYEEGILRTHYANRGPAWISEHHLVGRSPRAITKRAGQLGLVHRKASSHAFGRPWSQTEVDVLRHHLLSGNPDQGLPVIPGRTARATRAKLAAMRQGRGMSKVLRTWTAQEDALLRAQYHERGPAACAQSLGRTRRSVYNRAHEIGLTRPTGSCRQVLAQLGDLEDDENWDDWDDWEDDDDDWG